jgi:hypothetical protein
MLPDPWEGCGVMGAAPASLLVQAEAAAASAPAFSFFGEMEERRKALHARGEFTGERLFRDRPDVYREVLRLHAEGAGLKTIATACGVSVHTVYAVLAREPDAVATLKKEVLANLTRAAVVGSARMPEVMEHLSADKIAVPFAIVVDKLQLLSGEATQRIERTEARPDQVRAYLETLPVIEAELIEPETDIAGERVGQKGDGSGAGLGLLAGAVADLQTGVLPAVVSVGVAVRTSCETSSGEVAEIPAGGQEGGGGGASCADPSPMVIHPAAQNFGQGLMPTPIGQGAGEVGAASAVLPGAKPLCKPKKKPEARRSPRQKRKGRA